MPHRYLFTILLIITSSLFPQSFQNSTFENAPIGFAAVNAYGVNGTTGGAGGDTLYFTSRADLQAFMNARAKAKTAPPKVCVIQTTITNDTTISQIYVKRVSNLSIIGKGANAILDGLGLAIVSSKNIIVRNLTLRNAKPDCITINTTSSDTCHHIWIDHCTFSDDPEVDLSSSGTHDGLLDITHRTNYVTVSWCEFHNHDKVSLLGYTDNASDEVGYLYTTYHHNYWNNTVQRHPRVRHTQCHVYNNYYDGTKPAGAVGMGNIGGYGIASTCEADVLVEGNYFDSVVWPTHVGEGSSPDGDLIARNNITNNCSNYLITRSTHTTPFNPSALYSYSLDSTANLPSLIKAGAGAGKIFLATDVHTSENSIQSPKSFELFQNYPNPFNPATEIKWQMATAGNVRLTVYDAFGRSVATLVNSFQSAGLHTVQFLPGNLASGIYYCQVQAGAVSQTKKMLYLK